MKILFAVSNENISETIIKKYQEQYRENILGKNVYYFNAIFQELQRDKTYDRVVISEDLEMYANNNFDVIDKFIYDKLNSICQEAVNSIGKKIPIIVLCADRRQKKSAMLVKMFDLGIYNCLIGNDRSLEKLCGLINSPRNFAMAKEYYQINIGNEDLSESDGDDVSETEIQNILIHYKRLGKNEAKYLESFNSIATQYNDAQLRIIAKFLPLNVRAVLENKSPKYKELMTTGEGIQKQVQYDFKPKKSKKEKVEKQEIPHEKRKAQFIEEQLEKKKINSVVIIPQVNKTVKKVFEDKQTNDNIQGKQFNQFDMMQPELETEKQGEFLEKNEEEIMNNNVENMNLVKRGRGRPPKKPVNSFEQITNPQMQKEEEQEVQNVNNGGEMKKRRGRPSKSSYQQSNNQLNKEINIVNNQTQKEDEFIDIFNLGNEKEDEEEAVDLFGLIDEENDNINSPKYNNPKQDINETPINSQYNQTAQSSLNKYNNYYDSQYKTDNKINNNENINSNLNYKENINSNLNYSNDSTNNSNYLQGDELVEDTTLSSLITKDKKIVSFVGTSKNGTSFIVNTLAEMFSKQGIKTAILDLTKNKNAYYIYTKNDEELRKIAINCISGLRNGENKGIEVNKNLSVFTSLPNNEEEYIDYQSILKTLIKNYSVILLDCDFETDLGYIKESQELYVVQSMDVLTIQPLTEYLRELKTKKILEESKLKIIINKFVRMGGITEKVIIGGISNYNDPEMLFMTELFNKDNVKYKTISFETITYTRYLESLINCEISLNKYSKTFNIELRDLGSMVYPLIGTMPKSGGKNVQQTFSSDIDNTLAKMKNNY